MRIPANALYAALTACLTVLALKLVFRPKRGEAHFFTPENGDTVPPIGGAYCLFGILTGTLFFLDEGQGTGLAALLFTAAAALAGLADDIRELRTGSGFPPVVLPLAALALSAAAAAVFSLSLGTAGELVLPVSARHVSLGGLAIPLYAVVMLFRMRNERTYDAVPGAEPALTLAEAGFWCVFFCLVGSTGALSSAAPAKAAAGLAVFAGAVAGAWLGVSLFNTGETKAKPGKSGYFAAAAAMTAMAAGSGYLLLHPLFSLWPALAALYAGFAFLVNKKKPGALPKLFTGLLARDGVRPEAVFSAVLRTTVAGSLIALFLYFI